MGLTQVKLKLEDELKSFKTEMDALKKRFADLDRDNRKVVHEREELARAYKKSDEEKESSSSALASRDIRAGSVAGVSYSRAGSVARASSTYRGSSMARAGSMARQ